MNLISILMLIDNRLYDEAISKLSNLEQNSTVLNLQGFCHLEQKRYALARSYFFMAFEKAKNEKREKEFLSIVSNNIGASYYREGNYKEASRYFKMALQLYPKNARATYNLAAAFFKMKEYRKSLKVLVKAYKINPNEVKSRLEKQEIETALKDVIQNCDDQKTVAMARKALSLLESEDFEKLKETSPGRAFKQTLSLKEGKEVIER